MSEKIMWNLLTRLIHKLIPAKIASKVAKVENNFSLYLQTSKRSEKLQTVPMELSINSNTKRSQT